jgi:hypothetical protein
MFTIVSGVPVRSGRFTVITLIIGNPINRHGRRVMRRNCKDRVTNISLLVIRPENVLRSFDLLPVRLGIADAPDLGFRNRRFQSAPFRFKKRSIYKRKMRFFAFDLAFMIGE